MVLANEVKTALKKKLGQKRLFYVCRDVERAEAGLLLGLANFFIMTNDGPYSRQLAKKHHNILIVRGKQPLPSLVLPSERGGKRCPSHSTSVILNTRELLENSLANKKIRRGDFVLVFKPTEPMEKICAERGWVLLNPPTVLAARVEEKISQVAWLGALKKYLPLIKIDVLKNISWGGKKFILQFNRAHTGGGTILIDTAKKLNDLKKKFPAREARISKFVAGPSFTANCAVGGKKVLLGNISYQITGLRPFTDNRFATIGNDWALPNKILNKKQWGEIKTIATAVGKKLARDGWRGLYGVDVAVDEKTGRVYLIEINARQPASTSWESILQNEHRKKGGLTIFEAHLLALLKCAGGKKIIPISDGAQIIQRVTADTPRVLEPKLFKTVDFRYIQYENTKLDSDLLRMQTKQGVMDKHNELNARGNELTFFARYAREGKVYVKPRAGALITRNQRILLLKRHRYGYNYWVIPGGTAEDGESRKTTAAREILEETGLRVSLDLRRTPVKINGNRNEIYYFAKSFSGRARLGGPEKKSNCPENHYTLKWVPIKELKKINLLPAELKEKLIKILY